MTEKKKGRRRTIRRLSAYLMNAKGLIGLCALLSVAGNLFSLIGPMLSGQAVDVLKQGPGAVDFRQIFELCALMALCYAASSLLGYLLSRFMIQMGQRTVRAMRQDVFDRLTNLPVGYFDQRSVGDAVSLISYDIDTVGASLSTDLVQAATSLITVLGSLFMMIWISPLLLSVFAVTIPIAIVFTKRRTKVVRPLFRKRSEKLAAMNGYCEEQLSGLRSVTAYHREAAATERFDQVNAEAVDAYYQADYFASITGPSVNFINNLSLTLVSVLGSILYLKNLVTLGGLSSFVLYSRKFSGPINEMANLLSELQSAFAAAERVFRFLDQPGETADKPDAVTLSGVKGQVRFESVTFGYRQDQVVLRDVSFTAEPGSMTAIVGPTGAGKTTIINLLLRFYEPREGRILLDGLDIQGIARDSLRLSIAMVLQETWLFSGTVYENIAYGKPGATREEVERAARAAHIHDYIEHLPEGYDTQLGDDGQSISKGQKQLLTIARAMLLDAKILILDEATSNVDTRTERMIQQAMRALMRGRTCFVIAHRLSTIESADKILVLRPADEISGIAEEGTHEELIQRGGYYASLYNAQYE